MATQAKKETRKDRILNLILSTAERYCAECVALESLDPRNEGTVDLTKYFQCAEVADKTADLLFRMLTASD